VIEISDKLRLLGSTFISQGLRILTTLVLARLLTPKDYGIVALLLAIPGLIGLGDFGVARSLVQIRDLPDETVRDTGLVLSLGVGLFWALVHVAVGSYLSAAYADRKLLWLSLINAAAAILLAIYTFQLSCLSRELRFNKESNQNIIFAVVQACTGITLAFAGYGVYALVIQPLVAWLIANLVILKSRPLSWPAHFKLATARRYWDFGWKFTLAGYAANAQGSFLNLVVAYYTGTFGLGIFGRASQVRELVGSIIPNAFDRLLFPSLSQAQTEPERMGRIFLRGCAGIVLLSSWGGAWMCVNSVDIVRLVLGTQWEAVPSLLSILSLGLLVGALILPSTALSLALGKPFVSFRYTFYNLALTVPVALFVGRWSLNAVCIVLAIAQTITALGYWFWALDALAIPRGKAVRHLMPILLGSILSLLSMLALRHYIFAGLPALPRLILTSGAGFCFYAGFIWNFDRKSIVEISNLIRIRPGSRLPLTSG